MEEEESNSMRYTPKSATTITDSGKKKVDMKGKAPRAIPEYNERMFPKELQLQGQQRPDIKPAHETPNLRDVARSRYKMMMSTSGTGGFSDYGTSNSVQDWRIGHGMGEGEHSVFGGLEGPALLKAQDSRKNITARSVTGSSPRLKYFYITVAGILATSLIIYFINK